MTALLSLLLVAALAPAGPRALLLQQASGDGSKTRYHLREAGFAVTWVNKDAVAELPETAAGWRERYDLVFFGTLALEGGLEKLLSPAQLAAMKGFIAEGGGLVTVIGEAGGALREVLPVSSSSGAGPLEFQPVVSAPDHPALRGLPAAWPLFGSRYNSFGKVTAKPDATVLLEVPARYADRAYPFLVAGQYGLGRVVCLNSLWAFSTGQNFNNWEWAPAVFGQLGRWAAGMEPLGADKVKPLAGPLWYWRYEREELAPAERLKPLITEPGPALTESVSLRLDQPRPTVLEPVTGAAAVREEPGRLEVTFANGIVATIDKRGMVGYRTSDGLVLAREPVDDQPRLTFSGESEPKIERTTGGEAFILREALPAARSGQQRLVYRAHRPSASGLSVTFDLIVDDRPEGELEWRFEPRTQRVDGIRWRGVGESFVITTPRLFVEGLQPQHRWAIGGSIEGHRTIRSACYAQPRGHHETTFSDATSQDAGHLRFFSSGQPFQLLGSPQGTLWCYPDRPLYAASWLANTAGSGHVDLITKLEIGRRRGRIELPTLWYLYAPEPLTRNLWLGAYDYLREKVRSDYGIEPVAPRPTGMMRFNLMGIVDLRRYADLLVPLAQRLGWKRIDCGVVHVHDVINPHHGGLEALRYLCEKARAADLEVGFYCGSAWCKESFPPLREHPEWLVIDRLGKPQETGYPGIQAVSLRSGWWDFSLARYRELREVGVGAVWLDSWTMPNEYVNYADREPSPTVEEGVRYVQAIRELGFTPWIEGQSPAGLDSFWYRGDRYADLKGNEFILANTSPFAYDTNGLLDLDLFRLVSYHCAMFQDPRLLSVPGEPLAREVTRTNGLMNQAHDLLGYPSRVRETAFGTIWEAPRGYALFGHRAAPIEVTLPAGAWRAVAVDTAGVTLEPDGEVVRLRGRIEPRGMLLLVR